MAKKAYNEENILVGAADVFVGPTGDVEPTFPDTGSFRESLHSQYEDDPETAEWRPVGLTQGGVEFSYAPDFGEVEVDQWLDVAKMFKQRQSVTVSTTFAEATLENLLFAWGQQEDTYDEAGSELRITAGALGDRPRETGLIFIGQAPGSEAVDSERVYHLYRVLNVETSAFTLGRSEATTIPVSMRCLPTSAAGGSDADYGIVFDRTITTGP